MTPSKIVSYFQNIFVVCNFLSAKNRNYSKEDQVIQNHSFTLKWNLSSVSSNNEGLLLGPSKVCKTILCIFNKFESMKTLSENQNNKILLLFTYRDCKQ